MFRGRVDLDADSYVKVDAPSTRTSLPDVFAAGDLVEHPHRQAITVAGTGCAAAGDWYMRGDRWLLGGLLGRRGIDTDVTGRSRI